MLYIIFGFLFACVFFSAMLAMIWSMDYDWREKFFLKKCSISSFHKKRRIKDFFDTIFYVFFQEKGEIKDFSGTVFYISIDGVEVKAITDGLFVYISSLCISPFFRSISTQAGKTLKGIDIQILNSIGISGDTILKGKSFRYSKLFCNIFIYKLMSYTYNKIEEGGFRTSPRRKK